MLWENDFKNKRDWISLCKALDLPEDTVEIEMKCRVCVHKSHYTKAERTEEQKCYQE